MTINRDIFDGMLIFFEVAEQASFSSAAKRMGHSASHVSKEVSRLEERLGARLLNRTTRSVQLTETGEIYFNACQQIIENAREAETRVINSSGTPSGHLRVSVPVSFAQSWLGPRLPGFLDRYPEITVEVQGDERRVDLIADRFDVVVRGGDLVDTDMIAKKIMMSRLLTVATPQYLARCGEPKAPEDLKAHSTIGFALRQAPAIWKFQAKSKPQSEKLVEVRVKNRVLCNSSEMEMTMAKEHFGITQLPEFACRRELDDGILVPILEDWELAPIGLYALYPSRLHLAAKLRVFIDFLAEEFGE
ncbi:LysR family transcriptional regulator [Pseudovibrio sp. Tun.PSC04-5.I4]|uniref:LysR family transcriptional regulator n=1 Tax=Pseudovibrio sp. Tun.PSC04-5.I4 TaxID=1798213 RepID=UPI00088F39C4|nr:LysR family transcriptional regulator [Pseudovibrio sp. Tun.PSC04-5.I4]SDQ20096.1 DNA-binding transcriptional regulator, LysR family [Pseudovibrio sp. Tun.PSC04-5.I4]